MKYKVTLGLSITLVLSLAVFLSGSVSSEETIGYCPTMEDNAVQLSEDGYKIERFGSSSQTLQALNNERIDKALIGRKTRQNELPEGADEEVIESGITLTSNKKQFIQYSELSQKDIHTVLPNEKVEGVVPEKTNIIRHNSTEKVENLIDNGEMALINWNDWKDKYGLIVVMKGDRKYEAFRGAFLYSK